MQKNQTKPNNASKTAINNNSSISQERIENIINIASNHIQKTAKKQTELLQKFIALYYKSLYAETASKYSDEDLAGMALHHYTLLMAYDASKPEIAVINPKAESHHFYSQHTIVQIVAYDRPFLVDSILMTLNEAGVNVHRVYNTILDAKREDGKVININNTANASNKKHMSLIHCEVDSQDDTKLKNIYQLLLDRVELLDVVSKDWTQMRERLQEVKENLSPAMPTDNISVNTMSEFLAWILDNHFVFLGFREYEFKKDDNGEPDLFLVDKSGLGVLRTQQKNQRSESFSQLPVQLKKMLTTTHPLLLSKSNMVSPIHRKAHMDFLGIHKYDNKGKLIGEYRFIGLLTSQAYQLRVEQIPLLRDKAEQLLEMSKLPTDGHAYNKMTHIINELPRDDLFQGTTDELYPIVTGIAQLQDKKSLRLFTRTDHYQRFVSCLVYIPSDKFNTQLRIKIQNKLVEAFDGSSAGFSTKFDDSFHARVHFHVRTQVNHVISVDIKKLEAELTALMQGWDDGLTNALLDDMGENRTNATLQKYGKAIPASYKESFDARTAVADIKRLDELDTQSPLKWHLFQSTGDKKDQLHLKLYGTDNPQILSNVLPILENFGVAVESADTYEFALDIDTTDTQTTDAQTQPLWMQDYSLKLRNIESIDLSVVGSQFEDSLAQIWDGKVESDRLNELILSTKLDTFDVVILRALARYMIQAKVPFSYDYIVQTLVSNTAISVELVALFHARMAPMQVESKAETHSKTKPDIQRDNEVKKILESIEKQLRAVTSLDEDRIIQWILNLITSLLRTNFYQTDEHGARKDRLSLKFDAPAIKNLPEPKPMFEIYVYSPRVEAVHLRGGKVARGGLRWSDRMEDFRTEVLGLVKAQMVKNSVIVPVGSKGGFIVKKDKTGMDREAWLKEGVACYQTFIRGMLDITDNIVDDAIIAPQNTTRHDADDPYLVVAADKGTASFSDIANSLAAEYRFWLDDAFASGGSVGYDHKAMGITAKGAWESVKRHFRLEGKDIQNKDEFSVVGIGDMSGDVFGNGMLLSPNICLKAAFNHLHIFIDPTPNADKSYTERERIFDLPRSTWADYDSKLISDGGGVFSRSDKSINITPQMQQAFDIKADALTPNQLINALLKAPVDLLWNGGIGTYVKSEGETHAEVGDKANDNLRVNGCDVRATMIGEGGNLGCTQRGRIEYAMHGGRIYTDAIDNSAGVNCSDHEVNIKILLGDIQTKGDITTKQRNNLLESMTDTVSDLVLRQNYLQPQTIEISAFEAKERLNEHQRIMQLLESEKRLNREIELLPSDEQIAERHANKIGLTNPELSVLLAYGKMWVYDHLLESPLPNEPYFLNELTKYFPAVLSKKYFKQITNHRLHREIISTYLTNGLVNRLGIETLFSLVEDTGQDIASITKAYAICRDVFNFYEPWQILEDLDNKVDANLQIKLEITLRKTLKQVITWFMSNKVVNSSDKLAENTDVQIENQIKAYQTQVQKVLKDTGFMANFKKQTNASIKQYQKHGLSKQQATFFANLPVYLPALDMVQLIEESNKPLNEVAQVYFGIMQKLNIDWLLTKAEKLPHQTYWDRRANHALVHGINQTLRTHTTTVLTAKDSEKAMTDWLNTNKLGLAQLTSAKNGMKKESASLSALSVLLSEMNGLAK